MKFKFKKLSLLAALALGFSFSTNLMLNSNINNVTYADLVPEDVLKQAGGYINKMVGIINNGFESDKNAANFRDNVDGLYQTMFESIKYNTSDPEYAESQYNFYKSVVNTVKQLEFTNDQKDNINALKKFGEDFLDFNNAETSDNINAIANTISSIMNSDISQKLKNLVEKLEKVEESAESQKEDTVVEIDYEKNSSEDPSLSSSSIKKQTSQQQSESSNTVTENNSSSKITTDLDADQTATNSSGSEESTEEIDDDDFARQINLETFKKNQIDMSENEKKIEKSIEQEGYSKQNAVRFAKKYFKTVSNSFIQIYKKLEYLGISLGNETYKKLCTGLTFSGLSFLRKGILNSEVLFKILQKKVASLKSSKKPKEKLIGAYFKKRVMPHVTSFKELLQILKETDAEGYFKIQTQGMTEKDCAELVKNCKTIGTSLNRAIKALNRKRVKGWVSKFKKKNSARRKAQARL